LTVYPDVASISTSEWSDVSQPVDQMDNDEMKEDVNPQEMNGEFQDMDEEIQDGVDVLATNLGVTTIATSESLGMFNTAELKTNEMIHMDCPITQHESMGDDLLGDFPETKRVKEMSGIVRKCKNIFRAVTGGDRIPMPSRRRNKEEFKTQTLPMSRLSCPSFQSQQSAYALILPLRLTLPLIPRQY
jgi:hypothetical protein